MSISNPIHLVYTPKRTNHVKDSLYNMMTGSALSDEFEIDRRKMKDSGFELVHDSVRGDSAIPSAVTYHHYPSGSTVLVEDDPFNPGAKIFGERAKEARDSLVALVKPYGFELRDAPK